tara:strand:- start:2440 stop:3438 length:999 start_codon:yes stop_codon:yes gene_type:complete
LTDASHIAAPVDDVPFVVAALYKFTSLPDFEARQPALLEACRMADVYGTLLLASEGINGTIAGSRSGIDAVLAHIQGIPGCQDMELKESFAYVNPFFRMKVRLKKEIVTMGVPDIDPTESVGTYVEPDAWNELISDPDVILIDTRNAYEVGIGTFKGAIDPDTTSFREFPGWFRGQENLSPEAVRGKKVAMFCTGGIRCEKATAFVKQQGIEDVFHLKGGILKYLETVPLEESLWEGECFVFDQRVSVKHSLEPGSYDMCFACRMPIDEQDKASSLYVPGISCPSCHGTSDARQKRRFEERERQMELAKQRGERHIGSASKAPSDRFGEPGD